VVALETLTELCSVSGVRLAVEGGAAEAVSAVLRHVTSDMNTFSKDADHTWMAALDGDTKMAFASNFVALDDACFDAVSTISGEITMQSWRLRHGGTGRPRVLESDWQQQWQQQQQQELQWQQEWHQQSGERQQQQHQWRQEQHEQQREQQRRLGLEEEEEAKELTEDQLQHQWQQWRQKQEERLQRQQQGQEEEEKELTEEEHDAMLMEMEMEEIRAWDA